MECLDLIDADGGRDKGDAQTGGDDCARADVFFIFFPPEFELAGDEDGKGGECDE